MQEIRIIALDLDGTLLNSDKKLTEENRRCLEMAKRRGVQIVPATGRFWLGIPEEIRQLAEYAITINGARAHHAPTGRELYEACIPWAQAVEIMAYLDTLPVIYDCYMNNTGWMSAGLKEHIDTYAPDAHIGRMLHELRRPVPELKAFLTEQKQDVQKVQFFTLDPQLRLRLLQELPRRWPETAVSSALVNNVEINHARATKGAALEALAHALGCGRENVMAFGDGLNDTDMLRWAGVGVAMGNAFDGVKDAADCVTEDCDHDGVAAALKRYGLAE